MASVEPGVPGDGATAIPVASATDQPRSPAKPAPTLWDHHPGRLRMLGDLGWLVLRMARVAPVPSALWVAVALAQGLLIPAQLWLTKSLVDALAVRVQGGVAGHLFLWLGLLVGTLLLERALGGTQPWLRAKVREETGSTLQEWVMEKASRLDIVSFEHQGYYDQLNRVISDAEMRGPQILQQTIPLVQAIPQFIGYAVALAVLTPVLVVVVLGATLPSVVGFIRAGQNNWGVLSAQTRDRRLSTYYSSLLTSRLYAKEVRLYGLTDYLVEQWGVRFWKTRNEQRRVAFRLGMKQRMSVLGTQVVSMGGLLWIIAAGLIHTTAGGYALLFQSLLGLMGETFNLIMPLRTLGENSGYASDFRAFMRLPVEQEKVSTGGIDAEGQAFLPAPPEDKFPANSSMARTFLSAASRPKTKARLSPQSDGAHDLARLHPFPRPLRQGIRFEDVWFTYPGSDRPTLEDVSFEIRTGEKAALVGENGAGKTTLTKLLLGLYSPDSGRVTFDGLDVREIEPKSLRAAMSATMQQFVHYQLTFGENVGLGQIEHLGDQRRIASAVSNAGVSEIVRGLPDGYDTLLGPDVGGVDLSGGQWQRIAVARAFFRDAQVLVLDEPTAALDPLAELALFERFAELAEGKTALLISHRLGMARLADKVLVLSNGRLVEEGTHEELLRLGGEYADLFESQARWYR